MLDEKPAATERPQSQSKQRPPPRPKVRSYLHKFYDCGGGGSRETSAVATPDERAENELRRLLARDGCQRRGCHLRPIVWKAMLWIGVNCLIFGALGLAIAFFLPHEPELVEVPGVQGFVRSRGNAEWNRSAGVLKYVALGVFVLGAAVTSIGLILPSLVWRLFDEEEAGSTAESTGSAGGLGRQRRLLQRRAKLGAGAAAPRTTTTMVAGGGPPVDEKPVQPVRCIEEGHVIQGQIKVE